MRHLGKHKNFSPNYLFRGFSHGLLETNEPQRIMIILKKQVLDLFMNLAQLQNVLIQTLFKWAEHTLCKTHFVCLEDTCDTPEKIPANESWSSLAFCKFSMNMYNRLSDRTIISKQNEMLHKVCSAHYKQVLY